MRVLEFGKKVLPPRSLTFCSWLRWSGGVQKRTSWTSLLKRSDVPVLSQILITHKCPDALAESCALHWLDFRGSPSVGIILWSKTLNPKNYVSTQITKGKKKKRFLRITLTFKWSINPGFQAFWNLAHPPWQHPIQNNFSQLKDFRTNQLLFSIE